MGCTAVHWKEPDEELDRLAHDVVDAAITVHRELGPGFLESVYEEALCVELKMRGMEFVRQLPVPVLYKDHEVGEGRLDLLVEDVLVVEVKAVESLAPVHSAQVISYLKATRHQLGLLINFNTPLLKDGLKRIIFSHS